MSHTPSGVLELAPIAGNAVGKPQFLSDVVNAPSKSTLLTCMENSGVGGDFIELNCATLVPVLPVRRIFAIPMIRIHGERSAPEAIAYRFTQL
jgi:hypothetical protein